MITGTAENKKLFSEKAVYIATFFGGPAVAGYLMGQNYKAFGNFGLAGRSLIIGLFSSALLYVALFLLPENIIDSIPAAIIPGLYTFIIVLIFQKYQKQAVELHKKNGGQFHSGWKAAGIGAIFLIVQLSVIFLFIYFMIPDFQANTYDKKIDMFSKNENEALQAYEILQTGTEEQILYHLREKGIDLWQQNLTILDEMDNIDGLPDELRQQDALLRRYCNLRIVSYRIIEKMILERSDEFAPKLDSLQNEIDIVLDKLSQ